MKCSILFSFFLVVMLNIPMEGFSQSDSIDKYFDDGGYSTQNQSFYFDIAQLLDNNIYLAYERFISKRFSLTLDYSMQQNSFGYNNISLPLFVDSTQLNSTAGWLHTTNAYGVGLGVILYKARTDKHFYFKGKVRFVIMQNAEAHKFYKGIILSVGGGYKFISVKDFYMAVELHGDVLQQMNGPASQQIMDVNVGLGIIIGFNL